MSTRARTLLRRAGLSTFEAVGTGTVALREGFEANSRQLSQDAQVSAGHASEHVFARHSSHSLAMLLAKRVHVLVVDPSGCGKSRV